MAGFKCGRAQLDFCVVFHSDFQATAACEVFYLVRINADIFLYGGFQFLFHFRLRLSGDILDDGPAGFGIVADGVPPFPASVFALPDVPCSVCSSLRQCGKKEPIPMDRLSIV